MNELATVNNNIEKMQNMMQSLIQMTVSNTTEMKSEIQTMGEKIDSVENRMNVIENQTEVTTQQKNRIKRAVSKQVYKVLGLSENRDSWTDEDYLEYKKYSPIFHQRCYAEVQKRGHLASPYESTIAQNYIQAVADIEAWTPSNGIEGLKREADKNAEANRIAREQGYFRRER